MNIANLQLSRAVGRRNELVIRLALGAGRWQILRQLVIEGLMLSLGAGLLGIYIAIALMHLIIRLAARMGSIHLTPSFSLGSFVLAFTLVIVIGLLLGLIPAWSVILGRLSRVSKESLVHRWSRPRRWRIQNALIVCQLAIAFAVLLIAAFFVHSTVILNRIDPGFNPKQTIAITLAGRTFDRAFARRFYDDLRPRIKNLPGIAASSICGSIPLSERGSSRRMSHVDGTPIEDEQRKRFHYGVVSPDYFKTLNMPLLAGRQFTEQDHQHASRVMVINDVMAKMYWPHESPLGKTVTLKDRTSNQDTLIKVIGVVKTTKKRSIMENRTPIAYLPLAQDPRFTCVLLVRTSVDPKALIPMLRKEASALSGQRIVHVQTIADQVATLLYPQHAMTLILNSFAISGLLLSLIGIYSVVMYTVKQRTLEFGIRIALGAEKRHIILPVLCKEGFYILMGITLGLCFSILALYYFEHHLTGLHEWNRYMLFGVDFWNLATFIIVTGSALGIAIVACWLPAQRATRTDPMEALRYE